MTVVNLFPTTIYETYYKDDLTPYINKCMRLRDNVKVGGGEWINKPYNTAGTYDLFKERFFKKLLDFFNEHVMIYTETIGLKKVDIKQAHAWFNVYNKNDSQEYHNHNFNVVSGIFYLKSDNKDSNTVFKSPINDLPSDAEFDENNIYTWKVYKSYPIQGKLLLFRSNLDHCVERQMVDSNRITIAVNYK